MPKPSQLIKSLRDIIGRSRETLPKVRRLLESNGGDGSGFDNYTSLGRDCEVGFQLKRVRGAPEAGFFNWNITDAPALLALLEHDFAGILEAENLSLHGGGSLVHDASHDFMVHHEFDKKLFKDAPDFTRKLKVLRSKFAHFEKKFRETAAAPGKKTAYFYKCTHSEARELALAVQTLLARYHGANPFTIVIILTKDRFETDWGLPGIHNRYVERFAPYNDTPDAHVPSWDAIFREFPHKQPLNLANY